uniref:U6 snRNA-associated Sm-like protein LSm8 n=1 Tax=Timema shepardi TaxID=629360 RepID=A0A7R9FXU2_TIMSH|nr:unnamed protein product [Timema shepardi]
MMQRVTSRSTCHTYHSFSHVFTLGADIVRVGRDVVDETRDTLTEKREILHGDSPLRMPGQASSRSDCHASGSLSVLLGRDSECSSRGLEPLFHASLVRRNAHSLHEDYLKLDFKLVFKPPVFYSISVIRDRYQCWAAPVIWILADSNFNASGHWGTLKGFDQTINLILDESHERVYSTTQGVEQVVLGLHIIRGDNVAVVGELDDNMDSRLDLSSIRAEPLNSVVH